MTTEIMNISISDIEKMASKFVKSSIFGLKNQDDVFALMCIAQAEGIHPAVAAQHYNIIKGRPSLKAEAILARHLASGGKFILKEYTHTKVTGFFSHPSGGELTLSWTLEDAERAGLLINDVWRKYTRAMLKARVISEGVRAVNPGCIVGIYTPEEIESFTEKDVFEPEVKENEIEDKFDEYESELRNCKDIESLKNSYINIHKSNVISSDTKQKLAIIKDEVKEKLITQGENDEI